MSALYGAVIAEHYKRPRNFGPLDAPDAAHEGLNPLCGDRVRIELKLSHGAIIQAGFRGDACMVAMASASLLTEMIRGLSREEAIRFPREKLLEALQAPLRPSRLACATLPLEVLQEALRK